MENQVLKIFMVDDNHLMVELVKKNMLDYPQFKFMGSAASGEECLTKTEKMPLDVILMDIGLPGINGLETAETIIEKKGDKAPIIIFLTVYSDFEYAEKALELRSSLLGKRIKSNVLFEKITQIVREGEIIINPNPKGETSDYKHREKVRKIIQEELTETELAVAGLIRAGKTSNEIVDLLQMEKKNRVDDARRAAFRKLERHFGPLNAPLLATLIEYSGLCKKLPTVFPL